jgi:hypothetical protein
MGGKKIAPTVPKRMNRRTNHLAVPHLHLFNSGLFEVAAVILSHPVWAP